ncbi:MAG: putative N-acetyl-LL-diaminopimelate aminotransferase [Firmicutes bacterium ADurb.Bin419]|nr:MAG: putative N-acetyl-LL-diaminopimelate aminotransferase [Firmicutes bacterium ADurb.Bin419]
MDVSKFILPRVANVPPSGIRKIFDLANSMDNVIGLNIGEPDFDTPLYARNGGINSIGDNKTRYTHNLGIKELRNEISKSIEKNIR